MFTHAFVQTPILNRDTAEDGVRHYVDEEGNRYESVTTFISRLWDKDFLEKWRKRMGAAKADSISNAAAERGSKLHDTLEKYLLNDEAYRTNLLHFPTKALFLKLKPFLNKINNIRVLETSLLSRSMKLAGTPDCIAEYEGLLSTLDFKTSTRDKKEEWITTYWLQAAIYTRMYSELYGEMPAQSVIVMAVEDNPHPLIFIEPSYKGQQRLEEFLEDPEAFQKRLKNDN